jgi:hypothetical protein
MEPKPEEAPMNPAIYDGPEGTIHALGDGTGYRCSDDGGWIEGTFRTLHDAYAAIGAVPPQYPLAPGDVQVPEEAEPEPVLEACPACGGLFEHAALVAHLDLTAPVKVRCAVMYGPAADLSDVQEAARARRERDRG